MARHSDETLDQVIAQVERALAQLRELEATADVEGHRAHHSDETLKQAIAQVESALAKLRELEPAKA